MAIAPNAVRYFRQCLSVHTLGDRGSGWQRQLIDSGSRFPIHLQGRYHVAAQIIQTFGATLTGQETGLYTHHAVTTLEFEIKRHLNLNTSFVWDYLQNPHTESGGTTPQSSDFRLNLGVGVKF
jgi:hypothetical protein